MKLGWIDFLIIFLLMVAVSLTVYFLTKETVVTETVGSGQAQVIKKGFKYKQAA